MQKTCKTVRTAFFQRKPVRNKLPRRRFSTTAPPAPVRARAPPSAASVICCRCLAQLAILFLRGQFFLVGRASSGSVQMVYALLSRADGQLTRAGQHYYSHLGLRPPSKDFDYNQPLIREGPNDYILLRNGQKKLVRSLQGGEHRLTKLGKGFFRDKYYEYLVHVPVIIRGRRRSGRNAGAGYERRDWLPVNELGGATRHPAHLTKKQVAQRVRQQVEASLDPGGPILQLSDETYFLDPEGHWVVSTQSTRYRNSRTARRPRAQRRPPGTGWAGGRGRWPTRCACSAPRPRRRTARPLRTPAPQKPEEAAPGVLHDAGGHAALLGCALSLSVFSLWQSPHSACKVCTLPAKACLTGTTWSSSQAPVSPQPHSARLPSCAARVFCLSAAPGTSRFAFSSFKKISCAKPARRWPVLLVERLARSWCPASASARSTAPGC